MGITADAVRTTLVDIGKALGAGRAGDVALLWDIPGLILADEGARLVTSRDEIEEFLHQAIASYRANGTPRAEPDLVAVDLLSDRLAAVDVIGRGLDDKGSEKSRETSHYIMRCGGDQIARIHVAMARTKR